MDKKFKLKTIFNAMADELNISATMYERAVTSYTALGDYIKNYNKDFDIDVYPQGSFEMGTVIKPLDDNDQYDVDLVVEVKSPIYEADELREKMLEFLKNNGHIAQNIEEKKPCIRIQYADSSQFHMDIAVGKPYDKSSDIINNDSTIELAKLRTEGDYFYDISNPKGYIEWFKKSMNYNRLLQEHRLCHDKADTNVKQLSLPKMRTPLQKAVQILKRHRDIYFQNDLDSRPSSIIITTLCALTYDNSKLYNSENDNVYLTIKKTLEEIPNYIHENFHGEYKLINPTRNDENFLEKWNEDETLHHKFIEWVNKATYDIITCPEEFLDKNPSKFKKNIFDAFGSNIGENTFKRYGEVICKLNEEQNIYVDAKTMNTTLSENENTIKPKSNTFYGDN